jgi:uncharacterized phage protein (TIGR01671 family)
MIPKFRAWDKILKKMNDVTAIDFSTKPFRVFYSAYGEDNYFNQDAILMQSTGMSDINGVEIFEGDIVKPVSFANWIGVVKYSSENAAYILDDHDNEFRRGENVYLSQFNEGLEVKGNIYENPELMEV